MKKTANIKKILFSLFFVAGMVQSSNGCSVPVFRYALERWDQDNFVAYVFYRDTMDSASGTRLSGLAALSRHVIDSSGQFKNPENKNTANLLMVTLNLNDSLPAYEKGIWKKFGGTSLPWVIIRFPLAARIGQNLWTGPAGNLPVERLMSSPKRREMMKRLLAGESVVWIAVKSGEKKADKKAIATLRRGIDTCRANLSLPVLDTADIREYLSKDRPTVRKEFSSIVIDPSDSTESLFISMLRLCEPLLAKTPRQPILYPVFGRGRCLYALAGSGIAVERIIEANAFLIGPCACTVKEQNPGRDLLMTGDWKGGGTPVIRDEAPPQLHGFEKFIQGEKKMNAKKKGETKK